MTIKIAEMGVRAPPVVKDPRHDQFLKFLLISQFRDVLHEGIMGMWQKEREARNERAVEDKNGEYQRRVRGDENRGHGLANHRMTNLHRFGRMTAVEDLSLRTLHIKA